ncbi:MAG: acyltransferase, partial [Akkermansia sp.]|nr:acyltransferase [Akkermansia sp.]
MSGNKVFFEHINGLRGLAIILVVLFHLSSDTFPCCFYGVDIFLVITGYLLFIGLKKQEGSLMGSAAFAMKRAARILPPVAVLVFLTLCAGFFLLDYLDNIEASRLGRYTLLGMANVHLNKEASDYFAADFSDNPLMHMWYIGVTLQVYLMFIVGNAICKRIPRRVWLPSLFAVAAVSLALRYCWSFDLLHLLGLSGKGNMTEPSYFETLPRVWEVMAGGLVCILPDVSSRFRANVLTICGFVAVLLPVVLLRESSSAMFPVVVAGTVLIIRYYPRSSLTVLLCNRLLMFVGTISFSLYMVHLPVFVCYKSWAFREMGEVDYVVMLLLSFLFAWGYYKLVERPKWNWKVWGAVWLAVLFVCVLVKKVDGFKGMLQSDADCQLLPEYTMWSGEVDSELFRGYDKNLLKAD